MTDKTTAAEHAECLINAATEVESIDTVECAILGVTMRNAAAELTRLAQSEAALRERVIAYDDARLRFVEHGFMSDAHEADRLLAEIVAAARRADPTP